MRRRHRRPRTDGEKTRICCAEHVLGAMLAREYNGGTDSAPQGQAEADDRCRDYVEPWPDLS